MSCARGGDFRLWLSSINFPAKASGYELLCLRRRDDRQNELHPEKSPSSCVSRSNTPINTCMQINSQSGGRSEVPSSYPCRSRGYRAQSERDFWTCRLRTESRKHGRRTEVKKHCYIVALLWWREHAAMPVGRSGLRPRRLAHVIQWG